MRWYRKLYVGENAAPDICGIRRKAAAGRLMAGVYYITLSSASSNLLDIFHNGMLKQPLFAGLQCTDIVGVAVGKQEAYRLMGEIIREIYEKSGGFDVRAYFSQEDFEEG